MNLPTTHKIEDKPTTHKIEDKLYSSNAIEKEKHYW